MATVFPELPSPTEAELERMHSVYRQGGIRRKMAPHILYQDSFCPREGCGHKLQAIDFRVEDYEPAIEDPLMRAWWDDDGFAGRCPQCQGWIHFTILAKRAISAEEASRLPRLPDDWHEKATIL
jgi:hypothetical protein